MATKSNVKPMTADAFYTFAHRPENINRLLELKREEEVELSRPGKRHGCVCGNVSRLLGNYTYHQGSGYVGANDVESVVERKPETVRGPGFSFFDDVQDADPMERKYADQSPFLVVDVRLPNDNRGRAEKRIAENLDVGVPVWQVEPEDRYVTVFEPNEIHQVLDELDDLVCGDALPRFRRKVEDLFFVPSRKKTTNGKKKA